jgi:hypothetical protein
LGNDVWADAHALEAVHGGAEAAVLDIEAEVAGAAAGVRNGAVDMDLGVEHGDGGRTGIAWVIEFVAACCHAHAMVFGFLGTDDADEVGAGCFATGWDLGLANEEDGAGVFDALGKRAIFAEAVRKEAAPFVGEAADPDGLFGAVDELFDGALLASD